MHSSVRAEAMRYYPFLMLARVRIARRFGTIAQPVTKLPVIRVAVIGAGPAGFYTAHHLLKKGNSSFDLRIDFFEKLPTPYGLSRYGVAPDHPEVKNCQKVLDDLFGIGNKVRFFGNVCIGEDLPLASLEKAYHGLVLAYGCSSADTPLQIQIPNMAKKLIVSARQFVNWYNGYPTTAAQELGVPFGLDTVQNVTIIGNGNVALDVARVLLADPQTRWAPSDMASHAVNTLRNSTVKNVCIMARRGVLQSAFTNKELRELLEMSQSQSIQFDRIPSSLLDVDTRTLLRAEKRKIQLLQKYQNTDPLENPAKRWSLQFLQTPHRFICDVHGNLRATEFSVNELHKDHITGETQLRATESKTILKNELVITSIGYRGTPLDEFAKLGILFENNKVLNDLGRVMTMGNVPLKGWYAAGWIKTGPRGVIATTMEESFATAESILQDFEKGFHLNPEQEFTMSDIKSDRIVQWQDWCRLDAHEKNKGIEHGKVRDKECDWTRMVNIAKGIDSKADPV